MTNDERREVAARLRELPDIPSEMGTWEGGLMFIEPSRADEADYSRIHKVLFGCLPADLMHPCDYDDLHNRLADLIEPEERTCERGIEMFSHAYPNEIVCDSDCVSTYVFPLTCGHEVELLENKWPSYCPHCGARVVADA